MLDGFDRMEQISGQLQALVTKVSKPDECNNNVLVSSLVTLQKQIDLKISEFKDIDLSKDNERKVKSDQTNIEMFS